ncbi:hypothetical protein COCOR_06838 [Corallococcus coralloides DSM 2259]|uniref:Uncharacterized protein n=1 Tax=Corallococcus coralloides (strain ATCC 25202 / DSM 2259 / NBRC 100086 / M2) TaxID=1144275 RepID=H8N0Y3_CORCM|nr:hypothetical protein [Corallococcus coralloides]AFE07159.1 hypothetical protein COCOR_06838 [Corallococcus coralloides DSM 2259]
MGKIINLTIVNESNDSNNSSICIFQKNVSTDFNEIAVAWRVFTDLGQNWSNDFTYSYDLEVNVSDSYGNKSPTTGVSPGDLWGVSRQGSGDQLQRVGGSVSNEEVQVRNDRAQGAVNVNCIRDGKLLASKTTVAPGQKAVFKFKPSIFIGVVSQVQEGQILDSAIISDINTELSLLGISSAEIVMKGGGPGVSSQPFSFSLRNVRQG